MMLTLKGRTCVFAGATAGDGVEVVKALCAGGMNVFMVTHMAARAQNLVNEIEKLGLPGRCTAIGASEDGPAEYDPEVYERIEREYGSVDVIIHNTGTTGPDISIEETEPEQLMTLLEHLTVGSFRMLKAALPSLRRSACARVIFMSSVEGIRGGIHESFPNAVAKGAAASLAVNCAARLAGEGICVNCIAKGAIARVDGVHPGEADPESILPFIPMKRIGTSQDLAGLTAFLASEESSYLTGQVIALAGGYDLAG